MTHNALIRPAWTPATIALMILGFMIFWPLGLAVLAFILWGDRLDAFKSDVNQATDDFVRSCRKKASETGFSRRTAAPSGNMAFDEWREEELKRLDEERRKLDAMREEFETHMRDLRRARDKEEFDAFMRSRTSSDKNGNVSPVPNTSGE